MAGSRRISAQFAWASGGRVVAALLQALLMVMLARAISPSTFGSLAALTGVAVVVQTIADFGMQTFLVKERASEPESPAIATALRFSNASTFALFLFSAICLAIVGSATSFEPLHLLPLAAWIAAERSADVRLAISLADGAVRRNAVNLVTRRALALIFFLTGIAIDLNAVLSYGLSLAAAALISMAMANCYVKRAIVKTELEPLRGLATKTWPFWVNSVAMQTRNLDVAITSGIAGAAQAGAFSVASRMTSPLRILPTALASVLMPNAARVRDRSGLARVSMLAGLVWVATSTAFIVLALAAPWAVRVFLGPDYDASIRPLQIVLLGLPFAAAVSILGAIVQGRGHARFVAITATASAVLTMVAVAAGATLGGAEGSAVALAATFATHAIILALGYLRLIWMRLE